MQQELQFSQHSSNPAVSQLHHMQECDTDDSHVSTACSALSCPRPTEIVVEHDKGSVTLW